MRLFAKNTISRFFSKPFLIRDVINQIRTRLRRTAVHVESKALKVFISYSHQDEKLRSRLDAHLAPLKHMGIIDS